MQCHNYISDVYNKPNRLKIGWKLSKLLFKKYMYHYQHNVMGERADCGKMAAMCGRSTPSAGNADETSSVYIYLWFTGQNKERILNDISMSKRGMKSRDVLRNCSFVYLATSSSEPRRLKSPQHRVFLQLQPEQHIEQRWTSSPCYPPTLVTLYLLTCTAGWCWGI